MQPVIVLKEKRIFKILINILLILISEFPLSIFKQKRIYVYIYYFDETSQYIIKICIIN